METLSLFQLNEFIRRVIALNFQQSLTVVAEVAQAKQSRGHWYLDLVEKDETAIIAQQSAVLWMGDYKRLKHKHGATLDQLLEDGLTLQMTVRVDFHERYGLKLVIQDIEPAFTLGKLAMEQQAIWQQLEKEQLTTLNHQHLLAPVLQRIAIISSSTAAGLADLLSHLSNNPYQYRYTCHLFEAAMQGPQSPTEIADAIQKISKRAADFDVLLLVRGGGARLDLRGFDAYEVCAAIAKCNLPVITGIGHETDQALADLVAHTNLKTPTAVADFLVHHNAQFEYQLQEAGEMIRFLGRQAIQEEKSLLQQMQHQTQNGARVLLNQAAQQLEFSALRLREGARQTIKQAAQVIDFQEIICQQADPEKQLARGYSITFVNNAPLSEHNPAQKGQRVRTRWAKGEFDSTVD